MDIRDLVPSRPVRSQTGRWQARTSSAVQSKDRLASGVHSGESSLQSPPARLGTRQALRRGQRLEGAGARSSQGTARAQGKRVVAWRGYPTRSCPMGYSEAPDRRAGAHFLRGYGVIRGMQPEGEARARVPVGGHRLPLRPTRNRRGPPATAARRRRGGPSGPRGCDAPPGQASQRFQLGLGSAGETPRKPDQSAQKVNTTRGKARKKN